MRALAVSGLMFLILSSLDCGDEDGTQPPECQFEDDGFFELVNLDMEVDFFRADVSADERPCREFDGTLVEMPFTGTTGYLIFRDQEGNDYRFKPVFNMEWEKQLDGLEIGENYHFVISIVPPNHMLGLRICDEGKLLYLAASYWAGDYPAFFQCDFAVLPLEQDPYSLKQDPYSLKQDPFKGTELEGLTYKQLPPGESKCRAREVEHGEGFISLITNLPVTFQYGDQFKTLYQSQEATFATPEGDCLVHVLYSLNVAPQNYDNGSGGYSFYVKRLREQYRLEPGE